MPIFHYDADGVLTGTGTAKLDPIDGLPRIPQNATDIAPPADQPGYSAVFDGTTWTSTVDQRGTTYYLPDGSEHTITDLGVAAPGDALDAPPFDLEAHRSQAFANTIAITAGMSEAVVSHTPTGLRDSWTAKAEAARAQIADTASTLQLDILGDEAALTGETVAELAASIVAQEGQYLLLAASISGGHRRARNRIEAASDQAEIDAAITELEAHRVAILASL